MSSRSDSEGDFLWSAASNDSSDGNMLLPQRNKNDNIQEDSETLIKNELLKHCNDDESPPIPDSRDKKKSKKKKIKHERSDSDLTDSSEKKIKAEIMSDLETSKKQKKKRDKQICPQSSIDDPYLSIRVKEETFTKPSPIKSKKNKHGLKITNQSPDASVVSSDSEINRSSKKKKRNDLKEVSFTENTNSETESEKKEIKPEQQSASEGDTAQRTSKKKNSKKHVEKLEDMVIEDYFSADETQVQFSGRQVKSSQFDEDVRKQSMSTSKPAYTNGLHKVDSGTEQTPTKRVKPVVIKKHNDSSSDSSGPYDRLKDNTEDVMQVRVEPVVTKKHNDSSSDSSGPYDRLKDNTEDVMQVRVEPVVTKKHNDSSSDSSGPYDRLKDNTEDVMQVRVEPVVTKKHNDSCSDSSGPYDRLKYNTEDVMQVKAPVEKEKRCKSISQRIIFESEGDGQTGSEHAEKIQTRASDSSHASSNMKNYLNKYYNLKENVSSLPNDSIISQDDDIWLIKCPHEVAIDIFQDMNLSIDSKCKIKLNRQTYEGIMEDDHNRLAIISQDSGRFVIKNMVVQGSMQYHRRIPKCPALAAAMTEVGGDTAFIPLPDTRLRHPLLGADFPRALRLPDAVCARLRQAETEPSPAGRRKLKKTKSTDPGLEPSDRIVKKKRKRTHIEEEPDAPIKPKRIKQEPDSAAAWDSEKAIEESLFNF